MELTEVMRTTAAVRDFTAEPVSDEALYGVLDSARFAPSGGNRQGWSVVIVKDPALRRGLRDLYVLGWREYMAHVAIGRVPFAPGPSGSYEGPAVDLEVARRTPAPNDFADQLDQAPALLVVLANLQALAVTDNGLGRQSIVGGASIYPFTHNILLAARDRGLGGVMTTVICRQEDAVKELLGVDPELAVAGLVVLGHPVRQVTRLRREPVERFCSVDRYGGDPFSLPT
jgi:nitroreductase